MQNPLFEEQEENTRVAYGGKKLWEHPESFTFTKSFLLPNGERHGIHKVSRTFPGFGDTIIETSEWSRGRLSGNWEAVNSAGQRLSGRFENDRAVGEFCMDGERPMTLKFRNGLLKSWRFDGAKKLRFRWEKKRLFIQGEKFKVQMPKKRKTSEGDKVGNLLIFCLSLYGRTLLNEKKEPFVVGYEDEVYRIPCFPDDFCISELLPKQRWHDTIFCRPNGLP
ncbi:hypothetical protein [Brazilian marseillevirus]|uniref:hypothetical protein n=1 Tax=Brazilian marseillevirus TaxID=1813599 RepID=UPI00078198B6|nr:hypothetical protein A3303_gp182 [Brazilian marseillevirus]AMQ10690.1 hypothetical protein [Brazilian marseillevirus]